jgi:hypothetical protein
LLTPVKGSVSTPLAPSAPVRPSGTLEVAVGSLDGDDAAELALSPLPALVAPGRGDESSEDWLRRNGPVILDRAYEIAFSPKGDKTLRSLLVRGVLDIEMEKVRAIGKVGAAVENGKASVQSALLLEAAARTAAAGPADLLARRRQLQVGTVGLREVVSQ